MPYQTGSASSWTDLRDAFVAFATANGYMWNGGSQVLSKGNIYCQLAPASDRLTMTPGTSANSSGVTGKPPRGNCIIVGGAADYGQSPVMFPLTYHCFAFTSPDYLACFVNYAVTYWQSLQLGVLDDFGLPVDALKTWYHGSFGGGYPNVWIDLNSGGSAEGGEGFYGGPFWLPNHYPYGGQSSVLHVGSVTSSGWAPDDAATFLPAGQFAFYSHITGTPNSWNNEPLLIPIQPILLGDSVLSWRAMGVISHTRYVRNDFYEDRQIITSGSDRWMVIPFYRKNAAARDGGRSINHSGTFAQAVRYDGP